MAVRHGFFLACIACKTYIACIACKTCIAFNTCIIAH